MFRLKNIGWKQVVGVLSVWTVVAFLVSIQLTLFLHSQGTMIPWVQILIIQLLAWYVWALYTPLILWLGDVMRIGPGRWVSGILFHLVASIVLVLVFLLIYVLIFMWVSGTPVSVAGIKGLYATLYLQLFHWDLFMYWTILGVGYAFSYYRQFRDRELQTAQLEGQLTQAHLQALRVQLQPHFLFNTLNTIAAKVRLNESKSAVEMLAGLSDLLRQALTSSDHQEVTLAEEMAFLNKYLEIEGVRFKDQLEVEVNIATGLDNVMVPNLLLQPLVENALRHGIAKKIEARKLRLEVNQEGVTLAIRIFNEGPPFDAVTAGKGIGLSNTRERLQGLYGQEHQFEINNVEGGVEVRMTLPIRQNQPST